MSALEQLSELLDSTDNQSLPAARLSSAKARGKAKLYSYWGIADYLIKRRKKDGIITVISQNRASSQYRSVNKGLRELRQYCEQNKRVEFDRLGPVSEDTAANIVKQLNN